MRAEGKAMLISSCRVDITPEFPVRLAASPFRGASRGVAEPLEANILLLQDGDSAVALVSVDLLYPGEFLRSHIEAALTPLAPPNILVGASHTHYAPATFAGKPLLGELDEAYVERAAGLITGALRDLRDTEQQPIVRWRVGTTSLSHSINRRLVTAGGVKMAPNPHGTTDETAPLLVAETAAGPAAIVWNYACHPVSHPMPAHVAAHFPHVVRSALRREAGAPDLPVLFLQGFSGDTRPSATTRIRTPRDVAIWLRWGRGFYDMGASAYQKWSMSMTQKMLDLFCSAPPRVLRGLDAQRVCVPLEQFVEGGPDGSTVNFQRLDIGDAVTIVGVSAEVVSDYARWLRTLQPRDHTTLCVGCLDDTYGYLPTAAMLAEGGYEASDFQLAFGYDGVRVDGPETARDIMSQRVRG